MLFHERLHAARYLNEMFKDLHGRTIQHPNQTLTVSLGNATDDSTNSKIRHTITTSHSVFSFLTVHLYGSNISPDSRQSIYGI